MKKSQTRLVRDGKGRVKVVDEKGRPAVLAAHELAIYEDPKTGQIVIEPRGKCPAGALDRITKKLATDGVIVRRNVGADDE